SVLSTSGAAPPLSEHRAHPRRYGRHSALSTNAGFVRAAARAGSAAITFAATTAEGIASRTTMTRTAGADTTPMEPANAVHIHRPAAIPIGRPTASATRVSVVACHATVPRTCART